jgi:hypothetical protein
MNLWFKASLKTGLQRRHQIAKFEVTAKSYDVANTNSPALASEDSSEIAA